MKRLHLIHAVSCMLLLLIVSCDNQIITEKEYPLKHPSASLKSYDPSFDYYSSLDQLASSFYEVFTSIEDFRELVIDEFTVTGRKSLLIQELVGEYCETLPGLLWEDNSDDVSVRDIVSRYPNIRLTIISDIENIYPYIPSQARTYDGSEATAPSYESAYIAVGYKFVSDPLDAPMPAYTTYDEGEIASAYHDDEFVFVIEGGSVYSDEEIWEEIKFRGQGYAGGQNDWVTIIRLQGGRPKYNCARGFGICHAWILGWQAWNQVPMDDYSISIGIDDAVNIAELESVTLELAEAPSIDLTNVWLPVEEEIVVLVDETEIEPIDKIVPIQQCIFDPSIGEYGGFELKLENF